MSAINGKLAPVMGRQWVEVRKAKSRGMPVEVLHVLECVWRGLKLPKACISEARTLWVNRSVGLGELEKLPHRQESTAIQENGVGHMA